MDLNLNIWLCTSLVGMLGGLVGCFVVWKRLGLIADALSHSCLPGAALAVSYQLPVTWVLIPSSLMVSQPLAFFDQRKSVQTETALAVLYVGLFSIGALMMKPLGLDSHDLVDLVLGDVLKLNIFDLLSLAVVSVMVVGYIYVFRKSLVLMFVHKDLALIEGVRVGLHTHIIFLLIGLSVAASLRVTGVILMTSLMTVPPLLAKMVSSTSQSQIVLSAVFGLLLANLGLKISLQYDVPTGPAVGVLCFVIYFLAQSFLGMRGRRRLTEEMTEK